MCCLIRFLLLIWQWHLLVYMKRNAASAAALVSETAVALVSETAVALVSETAVALVPVTAAASEKMLLVN